jgi:hypothetical protein
MSLLDLIAGAGEEILGLRVLGVGTSSEAETATVHRVARRSLHMTIISLVLLAACWALARLLPDSRVASIAALGVYGALAGALLSAFGWAYAKAALMRAAPRRGRDA